MNGNFSYHHCTTFWQRLRGLMFRRRLGDNEAYVFALKKPSRLGAAVHTWFVFFPFQLVWLDADLRVVEIRQANPFRFYLPRVPAQTILEMPEGLPCSVGEAWAIKENS